MNKLLVGIPLSILILSISMASAITFTSKQEAESYKALTRSKGEIEIVKIVEILDEYMEVHYKFNYLVDGKVESAEEAMFEMPIVDLKTKAGQDEVKAEVENQSEKYFEQVKNEERIIVEYDDMKGWKYDGVKWTEA